MFTGLSENLARILIPGVKILVIVVASYVVVRVVSLISVRLEKLIDKEDSEGVKRARTLGKILYSAAFVAVGGVALLMVLKELEMDIRPLLAAAGIGGLAIGFGAQHLVRDIISGFFIFLENQFRIGDVIEAAGVSGLVESMNLRVTVLRDLEGKVHSIPNGEIKVVTNLTKGWSRFVMDIGVSYKEDIDKVIDTLKSVGEELGRDERYAPDILEPLEILGVDAFRESQVVIKIMLKTKPLKQWEVGRELRRRIKKGFDQNGIEIPFPHRTIYFGSPKGLLAQGKQP